MLERKIKLSSIDLLLLILVTTVLSYYNTSIYTIIRYALIAYLIIKYRKEFKKAKFVYILLLVYSLLLGYSSYQNNSSVTWGISGFMHGIRLISILLVMSGITAKRGVIKTVSALIPILSALLIATDMLIVFYPYNISSATLYLIGDKFHVSYMHCMLMALTSIRYKNLKKFYVIALYAICILITMRIKCTTGMIMLLFLFFMELLTDIVPGIRFFICNINLTAILLAVENILIWGANTILYTPWANHIIVDILGKSNNMTGRFKLYSVIPELIMKKPVLGYGLQSDIFRNMFGYGNAQNGLMQIVIESGILGAAIFLFSLFLAGSKAKRNVSLYSVYLYVLGFIIGSISEMNLSTHFVFGIALLFAFGMHAEETEKQFAKIKKHNRKGKLLIRKPGYLRSKGTAL